MGVHLSKINGFIICVTVLVAHANGVRFDPMGDQICIGPLKQSFCQEYNVEKCWRECSLNNNCDKFIMERDQGVCCFLFTSDAECHPNHRYFAGKKPPDHGSWEKAVVRCDAKAGSRDTKVDSRTYGAPQGKVIVDTEFHELNKYGKSSWSYDRIPAGFDYSFSSTVRSELDSAIKFAGENNDDKLKAELEEKRKEVETIEKSIQSSQDAVELKCVAKGRGPFQGGGSVQVSLDVRLLDVEMTKAKLLEDITKLTGQATAQTSSFTNRQVRFGSGEYCLDSPHRHNLAQVHLWHCGDSNVNQRWDYVDGKLRLHGTNFCLDNRHNNKSNGNSMIIYDCHGGEAQLWSFENMNGVGSIYNTPSGSAGFCVDLHVGSQTNGNRIQLWSCLNNDNQKWRVH